MLFVVVLCELGDWPAGGCADTLTWAGVEEPVVDEVPGPIAGAFLGALGLVPGATPPTTGKLFSTSVGCWMIRVNWPTMPPNRFGALHDEAPPVGEPVVDVGPVGVEPVVDDPVDVLPPVLGVPVPVVVLPPDAPVLPVVELPEAPPVEPPLSGSANATTASGPNASKPAVRRLEAASSRAWGITRRSPPLF
ncbi:hypothetical protein MAUB_37320 [Mycolicibacterium aubagnense]|uniref:Uncharacterized protein n=1 Tax=Mycolicibacterium aubagnense TaxID=319707 RepID=A0ABN5YYJ8_9MYCO|nr:hypothetical protein MAUB_37320 [Mycolicibacterium aubagnense]